MVDVRVLHTLAPADRSLVEQFLLDAHADDGATLDDHLQADLRHGPRPGFVGAIATDDGVMVGYAQASVGNDGFLIDSIDRPAVRLRLLDALLRALPADAHVTWWADDADTAAPIADALGMRPGRTLLQMRCPLPLPADVAARGELPLRAFRVGQDETAWLEVNNAAFAWHDEQGGWDLDTIRQREQEPWFRPDGFLLHERDGRLAAFCWTKLHRPAGSPVVGEIYVIAVHPDFHGLGLGRALTVAGLVSLHRAGAAQGMLYVDAGNTSAVTLYRTLGFEVSHTDQAYVRH